jgi:DNA-binding response OmpR family regulator
MKKILYADDEAKYRRLVKLFLSNQGYEVITVDDGEQVIDEFF